MEGLLEELPALVRDELRALILALGQHAVPGDIRAGLAGLPRETQDALLGLLWSHAWEIFAGAPEG